MLGASLDDVLDKSIIAEAIDEALGIIHGQGSADTAIAASRIEKELRRIEREREGLIAAIGSGRTVTGLLEALQGLEDRKVALESERAPIGPHRPVQRIDAARVRKELLTLAGSWRQVLAEDPLNARPIVTSLLIRRVRIVPTSNVKESEMRGEGSLVGLFEVLSRLVGVPGQN